jgi:hypothetical protein
MKLTAVILLVLFATVALCDDYEEQHSLKKLKHSFKVLNDEVKNVKYMQAHPPHQEHHEKHHKLQLPMKDQMRLRHIDKLLHKIHTRIAPAPAPVHVQAPPPQHTTPAPTHTTQGNTQPQQPQITPQFLLLNQIKDTISQLHNNIDHGIPKEEKHGDDDALLHNLEKYDNKILALDTFATQKMAKHNAEAKVAEKHPAYVHPANKPASAEAHLIQEIKKQDATLLSRKPPVTTRDKVRMLVSRNTPPPPPTRPLVNPRNIPSLTQIGAW